MSVILPFMKETPLQDRERITMLDLVPKLPYKRQRG